MATVLEEWGMRCPVCKNDTRLEITVTTSVLLTPDGTDIFEVQDGSHEWEPSSPCACRSCDWGGTVAEATVDDPSKPKAAPDVTQNFYLESNVAGMLCVRSRRDPSWSCDIGLFLRDPYDSYPQIAKTTIQAALQDAVKVLR